MEFSVFQESTGKWYVMLRNPDGVAYAANLSANDYATKADAHAAIADGSATRRIIEAAHRENDYRDRTRLFHTEQARTAHHKIRPSLSLIWKMDIDVVRSKLAQLAP